MTRMLAAAEAAHEELGVRVFPLGPKSKIPLPGSAGFKDASFDRAQITEWWTERPDANVGIACGESNLCVLDFDRERDIPEWVQKIKTYKVKTSRGIHVYFWGARATAYMYGANGTHIGEIKSQGGYVLAANSVHPSGAIYTVIDDSDIAKAPVEQIDTLVKNAPVKRPATINGDIIPRGQHDIELHRIAGKLRHIGVEEEAIFTSLVEVCEKRCENYGSDYLDMCRKHATNICKKPVGENHNLTINGKVPGAAAPTAVPNPATPEVQALLELPDENTEASIPPFDPSVVNGIYAEIVKLVTSGTTLAPQFAYVIAKTIIGARMAGKITFEHLDIEPRLYATLIGETGSGKGAAWRRIEQILRPQGATFDCKIKLTESPDSGAGLKELFFDTPEDQPVICYIDEVVDLGNKSKDTRNPGILDEMIKLADRTSTSRMLAKTRRTKHDARLSMVMCGQNGLTYTKSFAGRTAEGLWDRFYPEFGVPVEAGDMEAVDVVSAIKLLLKINSLDYSGAMKMSPEAKTHSTTSGNSNRLMCERKFGGVRTP